MAKMYLYNGKAYPNIPSGIKRTDTGETVSFPEFAVDADWTAVPGCTVSVAPDGFYRWNDSTLEWDQYDPVAEEAARQAAKDEIHKIADNRILAFLNFHSEPRTLEGMSNAIAKHLALLPDNDYKEMLKFTTAVAMKSLILSLSNLPEDVPDTPHTIP